MTGYSSYIYKINNKPDNKITALKLRNFELPQ
jgi:hypothetical protein